MSKPKISTLCIPSCKPDDRWSCCSTTLAPGNWLRSSCLITRLTAGLDLLTRDWQTVTSTGMSADDEPGPAPSYLIAAKDFKRRSSCFAPAGDSEVLPTNTTPITAA